MHHHRPRHLPLLCRAVGHIEADGELEVQLDGSALVRAFHGVHDFDVDLGPIEGPVTRIFAPSALPRKGVHGVGQGGLGGVPQRLFAERLFGSRGELEPVGHAEDVVDVLHELQRAHHLGLDLVVPAKDVGVVLHKPPHARETGKRPAQFISVVHPEVRPPQGQLAVAPDPGIEHEAVSRTVHGLHAPLLPFHVENEHGIFVVEGVPGLVPQV
mmetsp:Transcript_5578/g.11723  ORF Transcript_5578/g.11723 Transcript_5578/m.11723 type:complete len:213 (+) Transcript_5578:434-1072(+)